MKDKKTRQRGKHPQTRKLKWLAMLSALALLLQSAICLPAAAWDVADSGVLSPTSTVLEEVPFTLPLLPGDIAPEDMAEVELDMSTVPSVITAADIEREGHVKRLYEQESDAYTVIFQNRDLSKTTYIFPFPVTDGQAGELSASAVGVAGLASVGGNALVLNNAVLAQKLGNSDVAGGIMSYNIGRCELRSINTGAEVAAASASGGAASVIDIRDAMRAAADERAAEYTLSASAVGIDLALEPAFLAAVGGSTYLVMNTSDLAGDYAIKNRSASPAYLRNVNNSSVGLVSLSGAVYSRWLIEAEGGNKFSLRSQSMQTMYLGDDDSVIGLYDEDDYYGFDYGWYIEYDATASGTQYYTLTSEYDNYLRANGTSVDLHEAASSATTYEQWALMNKVSFVALTGITVDDHINVTVGGELCVEDLVSYTPTNATYKSFTVNGVNTNMLTETEDNVYDVDAVGVNKITVSYAYDTAYSKQCAVICSTAAPGIQTTRTYTMRAGNDPSKLLTLTASGTGYNTTSLGMAIIDDTWDNVSQAFSFTETYRGAYRITATLTTEQYEAPCYNGSGVMTGTYLLADEKDKNNTLGMSGTTLALGAFTSSTNLSQLWYIVKNGTGYSFINAANTNYALSFSGGTVGVGVYSNSAAAYKWNTNYLGINVPLIKQSHDNYCGVASTLQVLYGLNSSQIDHTTNNLINQMDTLAPRIMDGDSGRRRWIADVLNSDNKATYKDTQKNTSYAINSIVAGYPCVAHINTYIFPRYVAIGGNYVGGHYITVLGYDSVSGMLLFADCSYLNNRYGIYLVKCSDLDASGSIHAYVGVY